MEWSKVSVLCVCERRGGGERKEKSCSRIQRSTVVRRFSGRLERKGKRWLWRERTVGSAAGSL